MARKKREIRFVLPIICRLILINEVVSGEGWVFWPKWSFVLFIHLFIQLARFIHLPYLWVFPQYHQAILQFSMDAAGCPTDLSQFWHCRPPVSARPHRLRAQSHKTTPISDASHKSGSPVPLTTGYQSEVSTTPSSGLINLLEHWRNITYLYPLIKGCYKGYRWTARWRGTWSERSWVQELLSQWNWGVLLSLHVYQPRSSANLFIQEFLYILICNPFPFPFLRYDLSGDQPYPRPYPQAIPP